MLTRVRMGLGVRSGALTRWHTEALVVAATSTALAACDSTGELGVAERSPTSEWVSMQTFESSRVLDLDLLFVVDDSGDMGAKQELLADVVPTLLKRLLRPTCVPTGAPTDEIDVGRFEDCPDGFWRRGNPFSSVHVGVITTSVGGFADTSCRRSPDRAHLLASLPRGRAAAPSASDEGFFALDASSDLELAGTELAELIRAAGTVGCGYEATLEAWVRFLVDPAPPVEFQRQPCYEDDTTDRCVGPTLDDAGAPLVDEALLRQRHAFLRPESVVGIVMLSDENDCSFSSQGSNWRLADASRPAPRASAACQLDGNDVCCAPCAVSKFDPSCDTEVDAEGRPVLRGCADGFWLEPGLDDPSNLRCFDTRRRFGMSALYPIARYVNALDLTSLCPSSPDFLVEEDCFEQAVPNPLFEVRASDPRVRPGSWSRRPQSRVFSSSIVGVPWQDLAIDPSPEVPLTLRRNDEYRLHDERIRWEWLLPEPNTGAGPEDPLMIEQVEPRSGVNPATGERLAPADAGVGANSINGHELTTPDDDQLQYACLFPLPEPVECDRVPRVGWARSRNVSDGGTARSDAGAPAAFEPAPADALEPAGLRPHCACGLAEEDGFRNPACRAEDGSSSRTQRFSGATPGTRQLEVLRALGSRNVGSPGIVASICPKALTGPDRGYHPWVRALHDQYLHYFSTDDDFEPRCLRKAIPFDADGSANCVLLERVLWRHGLTSDAQCRSIPGRKPPDPKRAAVARETFWDDDDSSVICEIEQLTPKDGEAHRACVQDSYPELSGWCALSDRPEVNERFHRCRHYGSGFGIRLPTTTPSPELWTLVCASVAE